MPLNQSKPPLSFLLYSAFAFFFPLFLPPSLGHWCQTDLLCAGVCFCSSMPVCICTDECTCGCAAASLGVRFIWCVCMYLYFHVCCICVVLCIRFPSPGSPALCVASFTAQCSSRETLLQLCFFIFLVILH